MVRKTERKPSWNYLRVRGEYETDTTIPITRMELPPRARRIQSSVVEPRLVVGTTSACAENTSTATANSGAKWNYLRVRGEYATDRVSYSLRAELPPRARRIPLNNENASLVMGTTSACAENTPQPVGRPGYRGNYLRVRGEYLLEPVGHQPFWELPPRARRIPQVIPMLICDGGTTSACAENTQTPPP